MIFSLILLAVALIVCAFSLIYVYQQKLDAAQDRAELEALKMIVRGVHGVPLQLFCTSYADGAQLWEKEHPDSPPATFTIMRDPLERALKRVGLYYLDVARGVRNRA